MASPVIWIIMGAIAGWIAHSTFTDYNRDKVEEALKNNQRKEETIKYGH